MMRGQYDKVQYNRTLQSSSLTESAPQSAESSVRRVAANG